MTDVTVKTWYFGLPGTLRFPKATIDVFRDQRLTVAAIATGQVIREFEAYEWSEGTAWDATGHPEVHFEKVVPSHAYRV